MTRLGPRSGRHTRQSGSEVFRQESEGARQSDTIANLGWFIGPLIAGECIRRADVDRSSFLGYHGIVGGAVAWMPASADKNRTSRRARHWPMPRGLAVHEGHGHEWDEAASPVDAICSSTSALALICLLSHP